MLSLSQLQFLTSPEAANLLTMELADDPLGAQKALRKHCNATEAAAAATLRDLRLRAVRGERFDEAAASVMLTTDKLLQQASSLRMAAYVGKQLADLAGGTEVLDLCCGMGADAIGAAVAGASVRGIDIDERAVLCAKHNALAASVADMCTFEVADATAMALPAKSVIHIDPDRRVEGRRTVQLEDSRPGPQFLRQLVRREAPGAMKLSPALDLQTLDDWENVSIEYVSERGVCRQLIVWWGTGEPHRKATVVFGDLARPKSVEICVDGGGLAALRPVGEWIIEPDSAVIAVGAVDSLARRHDLWRIDASLAWLSGSAPPRQGPGEGEQKPMARSYRILREVSGREGDVAKAVRQLGGGTVHVKTRGVSLDTDALQRRLRGKADRPLVVLWCRLGQRQRAFIAEPPGPA